MVDQALVHAALPRRHVRAEAVDVAHADVVGRGVGPDVLGALLDQQGDRPPAHRVGDLGIRAPEAGQHVPGLVPVGPRAKPVRLSAARLVDAKLQAPVVVAGQKVILDLPVASLGHAVRIDVVLQALDNLRVPFLNTCAETLDVSLARLRHERLHGNLHGGQGTLQQLSLLAGAREARKMLAEARVDPLGRGRVAEGRYVRLALPREDAVRLRVLGVHGDQTLYLLFAAPLRDVSEMDLQTLQDLPRLALLPTVPKQLGDREGVNMHLLSGT
mmetsp:Transcript_59429/g.176823  ORF Transcript_59429/g.176823 Transcript_59429/m.176823 type:complete len:272 (+) Transcript_59429:1771-2586(+)